jgi:hypothetical protein
MVRLADRVAATGTTVFRGRNTNDPSDRNANGNSGHHLPAAVHLYL